MLTSLVGIAQAEARASHIRPCDSLCYVRDAVGVPGRHSRHWRWAEDGDEPESGNSLG